MTGLVGDTLSAPPPGSTAVGDLYVDLQTRTMWMGVDAAVDPAEVVLLSDIMSIQPAINTSLASSKTYTDQQIATRSPIGHKHVAADITNFEAAVDAAVANNVGGSGFIKGMVVMYSGSLADIGVGPLAGWAICDGNNGTPNLADKFVLGAGNKIIGSVNPSVVATTDDQGSHVHVITGTSLTIAQLPSHNHGGSTGYVSTDHSHYVNLNTGDRSAAHTHQYTAPVGGAYGNDNSGSHIGDATTSGESVGHYHNVQGSTGGISANHYHAVTAQGSSEAHTHTESNAGTHHHAVTSSEIRNAIPYYALAFIIKL